MRQQIDRRAALGSAPQPFLPVPDWLTHVPLNHPADPDRSGPNPCRGRLDRPALIPSASLAIGFASSDQLPPISRSRRKPWSSALPAAAPILRPCTPAPRLRSPAATAFYEETVHGATTVAGCLHLGRPHIADTPRSIRQASRTGLELRGGIGSHALAGRQPR